MLTPGADIMWDEIAAAAWIDPTLITKSETRYMGVDFDHGPGYGNTLTWLTKEKYNLRPDARPVEIGLQHGRGVADLHLDVRGGSTLPQRARQVEVQVLPDVRESDVHGDSTSGAGPLTSRPCWHRTYEQNTMLNCGSVQYVSDS